MSAVRSDVFQDPEINGQDGTQREEKAGQGSELIMQTNRNKEQFQFSQGIWHQTKEDTGVPATVSMETGAISEHQPHWRFSSLEGSADSDDSIPSPPRPPHFSPVQGRSQVSTKQEAGKAAVNHGGGWGEGGMVVLAMPTQKGSDPHLGPGWAR